MQPGTATWICAEAQAGLSNTDCFYIITTNVTTVKKANEVFILL